MLAGAAAAGEVLAGTRPHVELGHVPVGLDFKHGKLYPNDRPGLGVELDMSKLMPILEVTKYDTNRAQTYFRPDGSITNW